MQTIEEILNPDISLGVVFKLKAGLFICLMDEDEQGMPQILKPEQLQVDNDIFSNLNDRVMAIVNVTLQGSDTENVMVEVLANFEVTDNAYTPEHPTVVRFLADLSVNEKLRGDFYGACLVKAKKVLVEEPATKTFQI